MKFFPDFTDFFLRKAKALLKRFVLSSMFSQSKLMPVFCKADSYPTKLTIFKHSVFHNCIIFIGSSQTFKEILNVLTNTNDLICVDNKSKALIRFIDFIVAIIFIAIFVLCDGRLILRNSFLCLSLSTCLFKNLNKVFLKSVHVFGK